MVPNHGGDSLGSILEPMGSHRVKKWVKTVKITMPQNSKFRLTRSHRFFAKNGIHGYAAKTRWGHPRVPFGTNGVPSGPKNGSKRWKLPCPKIRIFHDPEVIDFLQKMEVTVMAPNHGGDALGSILGPMGSHWVQKMVENRKNYHTPKFEFCTTPRSSIFLKKMEVTVMAPNHDGDPLGSILGPMGSHWVQKMGQNRKNYHVPKFEFSTTPRSSIFLKKWK